MKQADIYVDEIGQSETDFDIKKWIFRISRSWYWFAGSVFVCVLVAWLYLRYTNPTYEAVASLMIKDEKKGGDVTDNAVLKELGINSNKLVENEIEILKSYDMMEEVVRSAKLYAEFSIAGRIRDVPLFGQELPFELNISSLDSITKVLEWTVNLTGNMFEASNKEGNVVKGTFGGQYVLNGIGFRVLPNEFYQKASSVTSQMIFIKVLPLSVVTGIYNARLSIAAVSKQASVVGLSIRDTHLERAKTILATLIDIYNRQSLDDKNKVTANTIDFLNDRLKAVTLDLQGVEGKVQHFKSKNQITDMSADGQQFLDMAKDIDLERAQSQTRMNIVLALENELLVNQDNPGLVPSTLGIEETSLGSLIEKHNSLVLAKERAEKNPEIGKQNPLLIDFQQQVKETRRTLLENVRNLKMAYQITLNDISRRDERLKGRIRTIPHLEKELVEIKRNQNVEEQLYAFLLQKREEAAVTLASNIPDSRTIVKSRGIGSVSPKSKMIWIGAFAIGIILPLISMIIGDFLNTKVGDTSEVEQKTRVPLIGMVSHIRKIKSPIVITGKSRSVVAEQIRTLRTAIGFAGKGKEVKRILVTSSQPGDGKSFISLNLAVSYALLGKKTVLIELDLRKPHVAKYLGIQSKHGVSSYLTGKSQLDDLLIKVPDFSEEFYLLPAGYLPPNPSELISTPNMEKMIGALAEKFEYIIIDTPPFGLVTDAVLMQRHVDITLAVLRQGHTSKDVYSQLNYRILQSPEYPIYAVLNGVGWKKRYQQGYGYGKYGYAYGEGYFENEEN